MGAETTRQRCYRFGELRRAGLFGSLAPTLLVPMAVALLAGWGGVAGFVPPLLAVPMVVIGGLLVLGRYRSRPLHVVMPALVRFGWRRMRGRHRWLRPVPLVCDGDIPVAVPGPLAGLDVYDVDVAWLHTGRRDAVGVVHDRAAGTVSGSLRVNGDGQFALLDHREQELRADGWGGALAGFARERCQVLRVKWDDWAAPVPVSEQVGQLQRRWADEPTSDARDSYLTLMHAVAPDVVRHEVVITVTAAVPRGRGGRRRGSTAALAAGISALCDELRLFRDRLDAAGIQVLGALSPAGLITAARVRSDPAAGERLTVLRQSLATVAGESAPNFGPMAVTEETGLVRVDRAVHRTWWFARWPRREVIDAGWLSTLIDGMDCTRTVSVVFEPIPPSQSDRAIDRELVRREANIESRQRRDFRVTGKDRKAIDEASAREVELNAGFAELRYVGLITLTAVDDDALEHQAGQLEQVAAQVGIELEPLWGQQATGWVASLPLGRSLARTVLT